MTETKTDQPVRDIRVIPDPEDPTRGWEVRVDGEKISWHRTKDKAVRRGSREGRSRAPAELTVFRLDGSISEHRMYKPADDGDAGRSS